MFDLKHCGLRRADFSFPSWVFVGVLGFNFLKGGLGGRERSTKEGAMEYYSAIKRSEALLHTPTRMDLESMLSKRSQSQNTVYCMIPFV